MTTSGNAAWEESNLHNKPLILNAPAPETQDTLVAAIDDVLHEIPVAGLNAISANSYSNYSVAGVLTNAFAVGNVGAIDNFYLIGAPPEAGTNGPLISGNLLDQTGKLLCRLERNVPLANPGGCQIVCGNHLGFEVRDASGNVLLDVQTRWQNVPTIGPSFITSVAGKFHDRAGKLVCEARGGSEDAKSFGLPAAFGFSGAGLGMNVGFDERQKALVVVTLAAGGKFYEPLSGLIENQTISLDGKLITDGTEITNCRLIIETGDFVVMPNANFKINNNELDLRGKAHNIGILVAGFQPQSAMSVTNGEPG